MIDDESYDDEINNSFIRNSDGINGIPSVQKTNLAAAVARQ